MKETLVNATMLSNDDVVSTLLIVIFYVAQITQCMCVRFMGVVWYSDEEIDMIIQLLIVLVVVGVLLWLLHTIIPIDGRIRTVIDVVIFLCVFFYVLQVFGLLGGGHDFGSLGMHDSYRR